MSVANTVRADTLPFRGSAAPGMPTNIWVAQGITIMDASGGTAQLQIFVKTAVDPMSARLYSLEQVAAHVGGETLAVAGELVTSNLGHLTQDRPLSGHAWHLDFQASGVTGLASALRPDFLPRPIFLGAPNNTALLAGLFFTVENQGVPKNLTVTVYGYIWEPGAILAPGGLVRPVGSIFAGG